MIKKFLTASLLFLFFFECKLYSQDTIEWRPSYKLKWEDFQASPNANSKYGASSACSISYGFSYKNDSLTFKVAAFFTRPLSWSKFKNDIPLLKHEQGHFDISELFARKLRMALTAYTVNTFTINEDVRTIFDNLWYEKKAYDSLYDIETNHARNFQKQTEWNRKIATDLNNYKQ
jgi:hypothetical protein